jgi:hypothetical protein
MSTINKPQNPVAWVTPASLRSLQRGGNGKGTVPVHGAPSYKSNSPLYAEPQSDAKDRLIRIMGTFDLATGHADTMGQLLDSLEEELSDVIGHLRARREWVGLTDEEIEKCIALANPIAICEEVEAKLKEKNT